MHHPFGVRQRQGESFVEEFAIGKAGKDIVKRLIYRRVLCFLQLGLILPQLGNIDRSGSYTMPSAVLTGVMLVSKCTASRRPGGGLHPDCSMPFLKSGAQLLAASGSAWKSNRNDRSIPARLHPSNFTNAMLQSTIVRQAARYRPPPDCAQRAYGTLSQAGSSFSNRARRVSVACARFASAISPRRLARTQTSPSPPQWPASAWASTSRYLLHDYVCRRINEDQRDSGHPEFRSGLTRRVNSRTESPWKPTVSPATSLRSRTALKRCSPS